ncbi:DUF4870 domain-containing protein [Nocardioides speluncae]|uniref:DUF4870 domain-containing protein n=1 Tax=Nocardioides speluncae TaxID=2670337 RepID=UPI00137A106E|nr:DUF4870 domain-containing protein [Nocardioides speluncae]
MSDTNDPQEPVELGKQEAGAPPPPPPPAPESSYGQTPYPAPPPGAPGQPYAGQPGAPAALSPSDEKLWAGMAHWGALIAGMVTGLAFLAPLLVLVIKGNASPWVRRNAVESLNFQLSMLIYFIVSVVLIFVLIGILTTIALGVAWLVFTIMGAVKTNNGEDYKYPMTIRMVS